MYQVADARDFVVEHSRVIIPAPNLNLSEWADEKFYLSPESAAEPGKWRTYSYQRGPMDAITDLRNHKVTWKKSARVGYTKMINCAIAYHIEHDPCSQLVVQPTIEDGKGYSRDEVEPMIRDTPCLTGLVADAKSRDSGNTIMKKSYPGGTLNIIGANSARGFRRLTVRIVYFDEVNGYPVAAGQEGDQITLGEKRTETFWNRLSVIGSTPTVKDMSRVTDSFEESDRRFRFVPCPICGHFQVLQWSRIQFPDRNNLSRIYYECENCAGKIPQKQQRAMVDAGEWRATREYMGHAGFHLWAAYSFSPGAKWEMIAKRFLEANQYFKNTGDTEKLKTWTNTDLGEDWEEKGKGVETIEIFDKRKDAISEGTAPDGVLVITSGADIQDDRIELEIVGWGMGDESWSLDYVVLHGDTERADVWDQLDEQLKRTFTRGPARFRIACACIDHGAHSHMVETFVKPRQGRRIYAVKGRSTPGGPLVSKPSKKSLVKGVKLFPIGTDVAKETIYARLQNDTPGPGFCHFPDHYPDKYFEMLTAEHRVTKYSKGQRYYEWRLKKKGGRNEALDCRVYAYVARVILSPKYDIIRRRIAAKMAAAQKQEHPIRQETKRPATIRRKPTARRKNWVHNW